VRGSVRTIVIAWALLTGPILAPNATAQAAGEASAPDRDRVEQLVETHTGNDRIQSERPEWTPEPPERRDRSRNPIIEAIGDFFAWLFRHFGPLISYILIGVIIAAVGYALWYMFGDVVGLRLRRKPKADDPDVSEIDTQRPDPRRAASLLEEADALAAQRPRIQPCGKVHAVRIGLGGRRIGRVAARNDRQHHRSSRQHHHHGRKPGPADPATAFAVFIRSLLSC